MNIEEIINEYINLGKNFYIGFEPTQEEKDCLRKIYNCKIRKITSDKSITWMICPANSRIP